MRSPSPNDHPGGHHLLVQAMVGTTPATCPGRPAGAGEHLLGPMLPATRPAPGPGPAPMSARWGQDGAAAATPAKAAALLRSTSCEPATAAAAPSFPVRPDAGRRPRRPRTTAARRPAAPNWGRPATPSHSRSSTARTARRQRRRHRRPVRPDTWMPRTPGHRTPGRWTSARPVGRTSPWRTGRGGQGNDRPGQRPDILATGDHPPGGPTSPGSRRLGALGHPGRLRGDAPGPRPDRRHHWTAAQHRPA
jgi:hypothetical protein